MAPAWKQTALIHATLLCVQIIFSGNQIASKVGMQFFHPSVFLLMRCIIVAPIMLVIAKLKENELLPKSKREALLIAAMAGCSFLSFECFIFGMQVTSVTTGTTLQATSPLWTLLIALALKLEGPSFMKIAGVICAILGAVISVAGNHVFQLMNHSGPDSPSENKDFPGGLILVANAMAFSGFVTLQKYVLKTVKPLTATAWNITLCAILVLFVALFFVDTINFKAVTLQGWMSVLYVSLLAMALSYSLLSWAAKQTSTTVVAVYTTVMPVLSPIMGLFMLHESISIVQIVGMVVTIGGVFLVIRARFVEEQKRQLETSTKVTDDVSSSSDVIELLDKSEKSQSTKEGEERVGITFAVDKFSSVWMDDSDEEKMDNTEEREKIKTKAGYAVLSQDVELREIVASA